MPHDRLVHDFQRNFVSSRVPFITDIHDNDEMFSWNRGHIGVSSDPFLDYLITGRRMLGDLRRVVDWAFGGFENIETMLDFASGYGRFTRHVTQVVPPNRLWISDIQAEGVEFQARTFGVHGFVSNADPQDLSCDLRFDLIFVASLFSHLPHESFTPWLERLYTLLTDRGILVFSVHDASLTELEPDKYGMSFIAQSESNRLDPDSYGTSYVSKDYVTNAVQSVTGRPKRVCRIAQGLCDYQDLYVVAGENREDLHTLDTSRGLLAYIDQRVSAPNHLELGGWAHDFSNSGGESEILMLVNGDVVDRTPATRERPDVATHFNDPSILHSGWCVSIPLSDYGPDDAVVVQTKSSSGHDLVLLYDTIGALRRSPDE